MFFIKFKVKAKSPDFAQRVETNTLWSGVDFVDRGVKDSLLREVTTINNTKSKFFSF
jgi:hypothetical protein